MIKNWDIISHNGSWFRKPTTILKTVRLHVGGTESAKFETSLYMGSDVEQVDVHKDYMDAIINHRFVAAQLGLKRTKALTYLRKVA